MLECHKVFTKCYKVLQSIAKIKTILAHLLGPIFGLVSNVFTYKLFFTIFVIVKCQERHERQERSDRWMLQKC